MLFTVRIVLFFNSLGVATGKEHKGILGAGDVLNAAYKGVLSL